MKIELVTNLKRQATKILADVEDYEFMHNRLSILEGIARGEIAILDNRIYNQAEARKKMGKWLT
ncbi:MAG: type II toxin-antitoxin system prevent-host-death family antitoxin [Gammaproteobacteria bacterium]|nr:MAG: type II toxin-antitoxin system prevent-host-death family antitoxin [Gammaproteobacteria bacterium]RKZ70336.1 MAG: type II toxin-antitoxin system prevent-host-death family antitoxin [Gammaproteobacteria bacterium]